MPAGVSDPGYSIGRGGGVGRPLGVTLGLAVAVALAVGVRSARPGRAPVIKGKDEAIARISLD